jgi:ring-1,2-phenylacetyl-CoA epoxidase subunit PaaD
VASGERGAQRTQSIYTDGMKTVPRGETAYDFELARARAIAASVLDPEVPVLTVADLGILRAVTRDEQGVVRIALTPTYVGCPAVLAIELAVEAAVRDQGFDNVKIDRVLAPAWTSDDITPAGREKLRAYGIAPPKRCAGKGSLLFDDEPIQCPKCGSVKTTRVSEFGSTACKALWKCDACKEPFDYFKCI